MLRKAKSCLNLLDVILHVYVVFVDFGLHRKKFKSFKFKNKASKGTPAMELQASASLVALIRYREDENKNRKEAKRTP